MTIQKTLVKLTGAAMIAFTVLAGPAAAVTLAEVSDDTNATQYLNPATKSSIAYIGTTWSGEVYLPWNGEWHPVPQGSVTYRCTGFVVNPDGVIATAGHCLEYDENVKPDVIAQAAHHSYYKWDMEGQNWTYKEWMEFAQSAWRVLGESGTAKPDRSVAVTLGISLSGEETTVTKQASVLAVRGFDNGDVGLLKVEAEDLPALSLATDTEVDVGTEVVSVGFLASVDAVTVEDMDPSYKDGTISSVKEIGGGQFEVYEVSAQMSGGMSGGPTLDAEGNVVGVNSFGIAGESKGFSFIRPASILADTLAAAGVESEVGDVQATYLAGLDAYFAGDKTAAIDAFDEVLTQLPSHSLAQEYRAKAAELPDPVIPAENGLPILALIGAGGVAAAGAAAVGGVALSRRNRTGAGQHSEAPSTQESAVVVTAPTTAVLPLEEAPVATSNGHRYCTGCGGQQQLGARFCPGCGTPAELVPVS